MYICVSQCVYVCCNVCVHACMCAVVYYNVCIYIHVHVHIHAWVEARGSCQVLSSTLPTLCFETGSFTELWAHSVTWLGGHLGECQGFSISALPVLEEPAQANVPSLYVGAGDSNSGHLCLFNEPFTDWDISLDCEILRFRLRFYFILTIIML